MTHGDNTLPNIILCTFQCKVRKGLCAVCCAVFSVECMVCSVYFVLCSVQFAVCSEQCAEFSMVCGVETNLAPFYNGPPRLLQ